MQVRWFSKFTNCLPEKLAKKAIVEKGMNLSGLLREIRISQGTGDTAP
jgi:ATP-dependent Lhr-like helicase